MSTPPKSISEAEALSVDPEEIARFSAMAAEWWDPTGKFRPLHKFNPVRLGYARARIVAHFGRDERKIRPLEGLRLLDIGCGGGLLSEPMCRLGASVVGADAGEKNIATAAVHAHEQGLDIDYRCATAEALAAAGETFDIILNMEVIEHVADRDAFLGACARMLRPGGLMIVATINRTLKALGLAVIGAEYVLGWVPRGTHDWSKFVTPDELRHSLADAELHVGEMTGVVYSPLVDSWSLSRDMGVNYMVLAERA